MRLHANCRLHPAARRLMQVVSCCGPKGLFFEGCYGSPDRVQCRLLDAEHHLGAVVAAPEWLKVDGFFFIRVSLLRNFCEIAMILQHTLCRGHDIKNRNYESCFH